MTLNPEQHSDEQEGSGRQGQQCRKERSWEGRGEWPSPTAKDRPCPGSTIGREALPGMEFFFPFLQCFLWVRGRTSGRMDVDFSNVRSGLRSGRRCFLEHT